MARQPITLSDVHQSTQGWTTDATEVSKVLTEQNVTTTLNAQMVGTMHSKQLKLFEEQERFAQDSARTLSDLQLKAQARTTEVLDKTEKVVGGIKEISKPLEEARVAIQAELAQHTLNQNDSFFHNPITYIRDSIKQDKLLTRLNRVTARLNDLDNTKNKAYYEGAQEIRNWRQKEFAFDYIVAKQEIATNQISLQYKNQLIESAIASSDKIQRLNMQRQVDVQGALDKKNESAFTSGSQFLYFVVNGTTNGWNPEIAVPQFKMYYESLPKQDQNNFMRAQLYWQKGMDTQTPYTYSEMVTGLAQSQGLGVLASIADVMPDPKLREAIGAVRNSAITNYIEQKNKAWMDNPDNFKNGLPQPAPTAIQQQWYAEGAEKASNIDLAMLDYVKSEGAKIEAFGSKMSAADLNSTATPEILEANELPTEVIQFYMNPDNMKEIELKAQESAAEHGSEQAALAIESIEAMMANGIDEVDIVRALTTQARENTIAKYRRSPHGTSVDSLMHVGVTYGEPTSVAGADNLSIPVKVVVDYTSRSFGSTSPALPTIAGESTSLFSGRKRDVVDLANPVDVTQLVERVKLRMRAMQQADADRAKRQQEVRKYSPTLGRPRGNRATFPSE